MQSKTAAVKRTAPDRTCARTGFGERLPEQPSSLSSDMPLPAEVLVDGGENVPELILARDSARLHRRGDERVHVLARGFGFGPKAAPRSPAAA